MKKKICTWVLAIVMGFSIAGTVGCNEKLSNTIVFHTMCDSIVSPMTVESDKFSADALPVPQRDGYEFCGWYFDKEYTYKAMWNYSFESKYIELYAKWEKIPVTGEVTVTVTANLPQAITFEDESLLTQTISLADSAFEKVDFSVNLGYKYLYYEVDGVKYAEDSVQLGNVTKDTQVVLVCDYATDELPVINIDTAGLAITSKEDYVEMSFDMSNCEGGMDDVSGGIRLRGNSTLNFPKKAYRIKFDKKQSLFGLTKAKSWVLLAEYIDPSALHNVAAFSLAKELDGLDFTPTPNKVNVYLNGEYQGLYTLCEQVQENEGRMDIEVDVDSSADSIGDYNFFICMDKSVTDDPTSVLNETYFYVEKYDRYIELKYPEKDAFESSEQFNTFFAQLKEYVVSVMDAFADKDYDAISELADVDSLIDFWLVDEIMGEQDHMWKSFNMYHVAEGNGGDGKLHFGPIWDYDWSLFAPYTGKPNVSYEINNCLMYSNLFFQAIRDIPALQSSARARYFSALSGKLDTLARSLEGQAYEMRESLALNAQRWYATFDADMTKNNVIHLVESLRSRKKYLDDLWS